MDIIRYSIVLTGVFSPDIFCTSHILFNILHIFLLLLQMSANLFKCIYYFLLSPSDMSVISSICFLSFMNHLWLGHWVCIGFNTVSLMHGIIFNKCTWCNLFTFDNYFTCLSIRVERFWYSISVTWVLGYLFIFLIYFYMLRWHQLFVLCNNMLLYVCFLL